MQLDELVGGTGADRELVIRDYVDCGHRDVPTVLEDLAELDSTQLLDLARIARVLGMPGSADALDAAAAARGYRLLAKIPRLPRHLTERLVQHFGGLQRLLAASIEELMAVEGIGEQRARSVREGLSRLAESSILERYV